ncbi:MAG: PAS domain-containing protein, partial [Methanoregula sp.]|nr:PAS domain-containing protein [Methanoregula sp.]
PEKTHSMSGSDDEVAAVLQTIRDALAKGSANPARLSISEQNRQTLEALLADLALLDSFSFHLSNGNLSPEFRLRGKMAGNLKALQANLRHITWQAQQITQGDFTQRISFLGDFSLVFNSMVERLEYARTEQEVHEQVLANKNRELTDDIEERKRLSEHLFVTLEDLKKSEERYRAIAEFSDHGIFIISREFSVVYVNQVASRFMKNNPEKKSVQLVDDINPPFLGDRLRTLLEPVFSTGRGLTSTIEVPHEGFFRWLETTIIPLITRDTLPTEVMVLTHDITERVMMEKELEKEGIIQIEKNMEQFQTLNDQIRNPLQVILGLTYLEGGQYTDKIAREINTLNSLVARLDEGWVESEKVRKFLLRHYRHGEDLDNNVRS